jgi:uncharacterized protein (TIGR00661 family)
MKKQRVLVCPLNWGIGHASRCVPIIKSLLDEGAEVVIAADGRPLEFLKKEFPELETIIFKGYTPQYPDKRSMAWKIFWSMFPLLIGIFKEHWRLKKIVKENKINAIISDNRFGLWSWKVPSVYITHQLMIKAPWHLKPVEPFLFLFHRFFVHRYDRCWVPDQVGEDNLSGDLSHLYPVPAHVEFIGTLSRFENIKVDASTGNLILALVSGPEPQRSVFEKILRKQLSELDQPSILVAGIPEESTVEKINNLTIYSHLPSNELLPFIKKAAFVICRSGYSTLMDLAMLNKKAVLIPTPGQTEQEYLAEYHEGNGTCLNYSQKSFDIHKALLQIEKIKPLSVFYNPKQLHSVVRNFLRSLE